MSEEIKSTNKEEKQDNLRVKVVSRLKYPVIIKLVDGENVMLAPHGVIESIDPDLIESSLPPGVQTIEFQV